MRVAYSAVLSDGESTVRRPERCSNARSTVKTMPTVAMAVIPTAKADMNPKRSSHIK